MTMEALSRRSLLRGLGVTALGAVAGFVVARNSSAARAKGTRAAANGYGAAEGTTGKRLATIDQVPAGGGLILKHQKIVLTRESGEVVHGFSAVCTHQGCLVDSVADDTIVCPCHDSRFDAKTGAVVSGPAPRPLPKVAVDVRDGEIYTS